MLLPIYNLVYVVLDFTNRVIFRCVSLFLIHVLYSNHVSTFHSFGHRFILITTLSAPGSHAYFISVCCEKCIFDGRQILQNLFSQ